MENKNKKEILLKINDMLKSEASSIIHNSDSASPEDRKAKLQTIEEIKNYIDNYDENMKIIETAKEDMLLMYDDGR